jgi:tetratricopeptide (TPR) repeat protein
MGLVSALTFRYIWLAWLVAVLLGGGVGCTSAPVALPPEAAESLPPPAEATGHPDQALLKEALQGRPFSQAQVVALSDRLLAEGDYTLQDQETMARLELLLLKSLKGGEDKTSIPMLWRNLGVIHFHQRKYERAQQELKKANEFNPRDARTHFYLARLLSYQAKIFQRKGLKKKARGLAKQAATEMELARKFAPNNPTYHQNLKQLMQQEQGK